MDYAAYRRFRDAALQRLNPVRLDCMNPSKALAAWAPAASRPGEASETEALAVWHRATGVDVTSAVVGSGVRDLLQRLLPWIARHAGELWLPEDVYPVYWQLTEAIDLLRRPFATLPEPDWAALDSAREDAVTLCPIPLSPLGRLPTADEIDGLRRWLVRGTRRLVVDAAYAYDFAGVAAVLRPWLATGRCVVLWSCGKGWLSPGLLGVATVPTELGDAPSEAPGGAQLRAAISALESAPDLPMRQQRAFVAEWERLTPVLRAVAPSWEAPETGYFATLPVAFETLLEGHNLMTVPASVFGSPRGDLSVVTCLHDLISHRTGD